jgi:hypothetical protein
MRIGSQLYHIRRAGKLEHRQRFPVCAPAGGTGVE